jgi:hypothetical protein
MCRQLPAGILLKFKDVNARIASGELVPTKRMGWAYYVDVGDDYAAVGSIPETDVFYWIWIGTAKDRPVVL